MHTLCLNHKAMSVYKPKVNICMCAYVIVPWVVQLPSVKLFMLTELSMCTHRKRVRGLINKSHYVISDKVVFTSVLSLETRNACCWASSEFSVLSQSLASASSLGESCACSWNGKQQILFEHSSLLCH